MFTDLQALLVLWSKLFEGQHGTTTLFCLSLQVALAESADEKEGKRNKETDHSFERTQNSPFVQ